MADVVLAEKVHPGICFMFGYCTVTVCIYRTPLRCDQGNTIVHSGTCFVAQAFAVRAGIKMQGISNVAVGRNRVIRGRVYVLGPVGCTHNDEIVGINSANSGNHRFGIRLNGAAPGY